MGVFEVAAGVTRISLKLGKPTIADLLEANLLIRRAKQVASCERHYPKLNLNKTMVVVASDAAWANLPGDRSGCGYITALADEAMAKEPRKLHRFVAIEEKAGRVKRVCRSTLAAETFSCSDAVAAGTWLRGVLDEILDGKRPSRAGDAYGGRRNVVVVVDAKALFDTVTKDKASTGGDKRVAVELSLLREEVQRDRVQIRWIPTKQNIADIMTKDFALGAEEMHYTQKILRGGWWTLGPDTRCPADLRGRSIADGFAAGRELWTSGALEPEPEI